MKKLEMAMLDAENFCITVRIDGDSESMTFTKNNDFIKGDRIYEQKNFFKLH